MREFTVFTSTVLPLTIDNIDTDQIVPARFLRAVSREGFGEKFFYDWRFDQHGKPKEESVFHNPLYKHAKILLAGKNFGVGSSREHAVWAVADYGFRVVIASSFGDIFYNNALKNGLLAIKVSLKDNAALFGLVGKNPMLTLTIDLPNQIIQASEGGSFFFDIDAFRKSCLVKGVDEFGYLLNLEQKITEYELHHAL